MQQLISKAAELTKKTMAGVKTSQFDDPTPQLGAEQKHRRVTEHHPGERDTDAR